MTASRSEQSPEVQEVLNDLLYKLVGQFFEEDLQVERYDRITDFTKTIAIIPISAKTGEGMVAWYAWLKAARAMAMAGM